MDDINKVEKNGKLDVSAKSLMTCEIINSIIDLFLNTFLVAYLLNITNENICSVAIYYGIDYAVTGICMYIIGYFLKKYNMANIYRIGILGKCIFVILIVFLRERIQNFEGVVVARKGTGVSETFTVRKEVSGIGVERIFPVNSPNIASITVTKKGKVRRAKLYFLRDRKKAYKIKERR